MLKVDIDNRVITGKANAGMIKRIGLIEACIFDKNKTMESGLKCQ